MADELGVEQPLLHPGLFPVGDFWGTGTAVVMLQKMLRGGRNSTNIQFETARKVRSVVSNFIPTVPGGAGVSTVWRVLHEIVPLAVCCFGVSCGVATNK